MSWRRRGSPSQLGRENGPRKGSGICRHFQRGTCRFGTSCRFSHDTDTAMASQNRPAAPPPDDNFADFKRLVRGRLGSASHEEAAAKLWESTLRVLEGDDPNSQQFVARDLASDEFMGLHFIQETMKLDGANDEKTIRCAYNLLRVITHPSLLDPLSVDSFVSTIYNFFGGASGNKAVPFFLGLCEKFAMYHEKHETASVATATELAICILKALAELLDRQVRSRFHEDMTVLLDKIQALGVLEQPQATTDPVAPRLDRLRRLVARETARLSSAGDGQTHDLHNTSFVRSTFPTEMALPGGRHDNDFADISQIQILPTHGEVTCDSPECLPPTDFTRPHFLDDFVQRYIDSAFRLLRHDIFGPVKDALRDLLAQDTSGAGFKPRVHGNTMARLYMGASVPHVFVDKGGLEAVVSFESPHQVRDKSSSEQRRWWQESSRLEEGSLIAFVSSRGGEKLLLFLEVTRKNTGADKGDGRETSLVTGSNRARLGVKPATLSSHTLGVLTRLHGERITGVLVEFHGLIPATFVPILSNLQKMMREGDLAFREWVLPMEEASNNAAAICDMPPPAYARSPGFDFRLDPITQDGGSLLVTEAREDALAMLERRTTLDRGQCEALFAALTREYALIQGPPGTGKSYVGVQLVRVLLENKEKAGLGPILIICYTNHALDQFLQHLLAVGISKMIRIGGRSQAKELEGKNLRVVRGEVQKTTVERHLLGSTFKELEESQKMAGTTLKFLHQTKKGPTWDPLERFLLQESPEIHRQLNPAGNEGFEVVGGDCLAAWLGQRPRGSDAQMDALKDGDSFQNLTARAETDINSLSPLERWAMAETWLARAREQQTGRLLERLNEANELRRAINKVHDDISRRTLLQADVVGVTTTGLARNMAMLRHVRPKVVVCEEAAEIMEAHLISALMPGVEHFIQIGDHRQLRPQILNHSLSLETSSGRAWQLDRSQFERRATGEPGMRAAPVAQLDVQRRMRPEVARLIRTVYPNLRDHPSVMELPDVVGMRTNLYWLDHNHPEAAAKDGEPRVKSHSNDWEVDMATALVRHLVRQGEYAASDIALLTPYTGQLRKLRAGLSREFEVFLGERDLDVLAFEDDGEGSNREASDTQERHKTLQKKQLTQTLRLATVDNFQGEEAKVVVVSLVRSNRDRKVGFLRTENRINVLLSRAQHGMYLIGNTDTYLHVGMWSDVHAQLAQADAVGDAFPLCCPRHPDKTILCSEPDDFARKSPEGGCELPCDERLEPCGHRCRARCHSRAMHDAFLCPRECPRIRSTCQHACKKLCGETCGPCFEEVRDVELPCGHIRPSMRCYERQDLSRIRCTAKVKKMAPLCRHVVEVDCYKDVESPLYSCPIPCDQMLACGHQCPGSCGRCGENEGHGRCTRVCDRPYGTCHHRCSKPCHDGEGCGTCENPCEIQCPHSRCAAPCRLPCAPCIEKCTWACAHRGACTMPCAAPCDRLPCDERCPETLGCGHRCPGLCGEECPDGKFCQECGDHSGARVDFLEFKEYAQIDVDKTPVVVLTCGHLFTSESLDMLVGMSDVYNIRATDGGYDGLKDISSALARTFSTKRYNRVINKAAMDETTKRFLSSGNQSLGDLEKRLMALKKPLGFKSPSDRHEAARQLARDADDLCKRMDTEHQPAKKLHDAIVARQRTTGPSSLEDGMQELAIGVSSSSPDQHGVVSALDKQVTLKARLLHIKALDTILCDKLSGKGKNMTHRRDTTRLLESCAHLVTNATEANLPRVSIEAILTYAGIFQLQASRLGTESGETPLSLPWDHEAVGEKLSEAASLCERLPNSEGLREAVDSMAKLFRGAWYEEVTAREIEAIKSAVLSGRDGIATHSGHWYYCANGHPFLIGECGMPMELAQCSECGAPIGGENHTLVEGATRATAME
ncbi:hypothetical protein ACRALDRAFT_1049711 [Sodiomyces alcalophilus JCM 7366]|uniref:uncharacterized protein n=1 Tax=Sodiomyces alcalophilus JCM 7366 TaxID=591952 RepID=UPI0039B451AE